MRHRPLPIRLEPSRFGGFRERSGPMVTTADGRVLSDEAVQAFATGVRGEVLRPGDAGYDEARTIQNGLIDRHPALIIRCSGAADVMAAVSFAREQGLTLS